MDLDTTLITNVGVHDALTEDPAALTDRISSRFLTIGAGFALEKADLFSAQAARGAAQVVLVSKPDIAFWQQCHGALMEARQNIAIPCLLFSRIIPSLNLQNIGSLAPLTVVGVLYGVLGAALAWIIKQFFWVPHRFRYGILAAGGWGNYGDIRT
jgi:predicted permease